MMNEYLLPVAAIVITLLLAACVLLLVLWVKGGIKCRETEKTLLQKMGEKTDFFFNMTHELKTPLSVILGAVQLMEMKNRQAADGESLDNNLKIIRCNCYRMLRLTNNLLDLARLDSGYMVLKPVNCNISLLLEEIVQSVTPYAEHNNLNLQYSKPAEAIYTAVDIEKMERILLNLLSNAIKFSRPGGSILVSSYRAGDKVFISVMDSGTGIPADKQKEIFTRFKQLDNNPSSINKGSGIGLSLVKSFVRLHQGDIRIDSEPGKGCDFIVELPIRLLNNDAGQTRPLDYNAQIAEATTIEFSIFHSVAL